MSILWIEDELCFDPEERGQQVGIDVCHHGVPFDEICEDCNEEEEEEGL